MNPKYNKYVFALAFASMLTLGACGDDFLGKDPQGALTPEALGNAQGVELLTTSAYAALSIQWRIKIPIKRLRSIGYGVVSMVVMRIKAPTPVISPL